MKVLVLANIEASGEWIATESLLWELKKKNNDIHLYLAAHGKSGRSLKKNLFSKSVVHKKPLPPPPFRYYRQLPAEFFQNRRVIKELVDKNGPFDLVVGIDPFWLLSAFSLGLSAKSVFWFHGFRTYYRFNLANFNLYIFIRKYLERLAFLFSAKIIVPSDFGKKMLMRELSIFSRFKKIIIVPNVPRSVFFKRFNQIELRSFGVRMGIPKGKKAIVFSGIIDPRKGLLELLDGFSALIKQHNNIYLVIAYLSSASDAVYHGELMARISRLGLENNVKLLKDLKPNELVKLYQRADCAILPSTFEVNSLCVLETLASGKPVFTTNVGAGPELVRQINKLLILPNNSPQSIYIRLKYFFSMSEDWHKIIRQKIEEKFANFDFVSPTTSLEQQFYLFKKL